MRGVAPAKRLPRAHLRPGECNTPRCFRYTYVATARRFGRIAAARVADAAYELSANPADDAERVQLATIARSANRTVARNMCPTVEDVPGTQMASIATATPTWPCPPVSLRTTAQASS